MADSGTAFFTDSQQFAPPFFLPTRRRFRSGRTNPDGRYFPDTFAMAPATRAFSMGGFSTVAAASAAASILRSLRIKNSSSSSFGPNQFVSIAIQDHASLERVPDQLFLTRFFEGLADDAAQSSNCSICWSRAFCSGGFGSGKVCK